MLLIDWKTYLAARKDKTAGNKDTSVFAKAWSPEKSTVSRTQEAPCSIPRRNKYWNIGRKSVADDAGPAPPPPSSTTILVGPDGEGGGPIHGAPEVRAAVTEGEEGRGTCTAALL